jgi:nicotinate-nucleotide pyrophosphorylase
MRDQDVRELIVHGKDDLTPGGRFLQTEAAILGGHSRHRATLGPLLETLLDRWIALVA